MGKQAVAEIVLRDGVAYDGYAACARNDKDRLAELMSLNASELRADAAHEFGMTPLHWAARAGSIYCAEALLDHGADPRVKNVKGKTAFEIARKGAKSLRERA